jgi:hypothetical protein
MKNLIVCLLLLLAFPTVFVFAQENVFDLTRIEQEINEYGVPTLGSVDKIGIEANKLYEEENWSEAAKAYELYSKYCNLLTNLFYKLAEPSLVSEKEAYKLGLYYPELIDEFENLANKFRYYRVEKGKAIHRQGICFFNLSNYSKSLPFIIQSLDLIKLTNYTSMEERKMWGEARSALYSIIKYEK